MFLCFSLNFGKCKTNEENIMDLCDCFDEEAGGDGKLFWDCILVCFDFDVSYCLSLCSHICDCNLFALNMVRFLFCSHACDMQP